MSGSLQERGSVLSAVLSATLPENEKVSSVSIACKVYFCQDESVCLFQEVIFRVPVNEQRAPGEHNIALRYGLSPRASSVDFPQYAQGV